MRFPERVDADGDGTGLGPAVVREIAAAHGRSVRRTGADDGGARFEVTTAGDSTRAPSPDQ